MSVAFGWKLKRAHVVTTEGRYPHSCVVHQAAWRPPHFVAYMPGYIDDILGFVVQHEMSVRICVLKQRGTRHYRPGAPGIRKTRYSALPSC